MGIILYAVRNLKRCVIQVQNMLPSGASDQDIMENAKNLLMQDPKLKKGFKFDQVWLLMKDIPKFSDNVNIGIPDIESDTVGSPASQSPGISSFSINLSSHDGGSNSSQRPIGPKKAKLKRKLSEGNTSSMDNVVSVNEQNSRFLERKWII
uniref:No apical meristem-associated C-terminal domain-containing protein n=1 Tax=Brassica oleracea var. oleracea TaxID=109376 RepID=A0A0D3E7F5_BRAOL